MHSNNYFCELQYCFLCRCNRHCRAYTDGETPVSDINRKAAVTPLRLALLVVAVATCQAAHRHCPCSVLIKDACADIDIVAIVRFNQLLPEVHMCSARVHPSGARSIL